MQPNAHGTRSALLSATALAIVLLLVVGLAAPVEIAAASTRQTLSVSESTPASVLTGNVTSGATRWQGQRLTFQAGATNAHVNYELRRVAKDGTVGALVYQFTLDSHARAVLQTTELSGAFVVLNQDHKVVDVGRNGRQKSVVGTGAYAVKTGEFEIVAQRLNVSFERASVTNSKQGSATSKLTVDSNRGTFPLTVSADGLSNKQLTRIFGGSVVSADGQTVVVRRGVTTADGLTADFTGVPPGTYNVTFGVADNGVVTRDEITVVPSDEASATFESNSFESHRGDVATVPIDLQNSEGADFAIGGDGVGYNVTGRVSDTDGDGRALVEVNTYTGNVSFGAGTTGTATVNRRPDGPLGRGTYQLQVGTSGVGEQAQGLATLDVGGRSTGDAVTWVVPGETNVSTVGNLLRADGAGELTHRTDVAIGDKVVVQVRATGLSGLVEAAGDNLSRVENSLGVSVTRVDQGQNGEASVVDARNVTALPDPTNGSLFLVLNLSSQSGIEPVRTYRTTVTLRNASGLTTDGAERVSTGFRTHRRTATIAVNSKGDANVSADSTATVRGTSSVAPGTTITVRVRSGNVDVPFVHRKSVRVGIHGNWKATFNLSGVEPGTRFVASVEDPSTVATGYVLKGVGGAGASTDGSATGSQNASATPSSTGVTDSTIQPGFGLVLALFGLAVGALVAWQRR